MMKVLTNKKQISAHKNGDLVSSSNSKKKGEPRVISKSELLYKSVPRCVLRDKTNNFPANVKSSVYTPVGYQKSEDRLISETNALRMSGNNLSFDFIQKQKKDTMKMSETSQNQANADVYEFILDEGEVNENKPKKKKTTKRKRAQRKIIDSPEEVLPVKKNRKPLQDKVSKNLIPKSNRKDGLGNKELNVSSANPFTDVLHPVKAKMKTVHFNNLSGDVIKKSSSGMQIKHCTPIGTTKNVDSPENVQVIQTSTETNGKGSKPNSSTSLHPSLQIKSARSSMTKINHVSSPSVSECGRLDVRMKGNEVSKKLLSFFSPPRTTANSGNSYSNLVSEETPAKQVVARSCNTDTENTEISHENVQCSIPSTAVRQHLDKAQENLDVSNYFGFDDDTDSEDEDFSPAKTFTKSSQKLGKFQCSTPKDVSQKNGASKPFRFPDLSVVKKRKFLEIARNAPATVTNIKESSSSTSKTKHCIPVSSPVAKTPKSATVTNLSGKTAYESSGSTSKRKPCSPVSPPVTKSTKPATVTNISDKPAYESPGSSSKRKPCSPANFPVKESPKPAIFDLEDELHEFQGDEKYNGEHQLQVTFKDCEAVSSPQKKVMQKSYGTSRHARLRVPLYDEVKTAASEDEAEEIVPKKHKKTHRPPKSKEADVWAKSFNSMCETIDSFELVVE